MTFRWGILIGLVSAVLVPVAAFAAGTFSDDDGNTHEANIEAIAAEGITKGCNPPANDLYCPSDPVSRGQMAAFLHRALDDVLTPSDPVEFNDDNGSIFESDIEWLGATGVTKGCNPPENDEYCPNDFVTRGQMAAFIARAMAYTDDGGGDLFVDDDGNTFEADIDKLAAAGVTKGCNPPTNNKYCPDDLVLRDQMASFLARALGLDPIAPLPSSSVVLEASGLHVADFGDPAETVIAALTEVLGEPEEDTGWEDSWGRFGSCPGNYIRGVRWGPLWTVYVDAAEPNEWANLPAGQYFFNYSVSQDSMDGTVHLTTEKDIGVGDTLDELKEAYGNKVDAYYSEVFGWGFVLDRPDTEEPWPSRGGSLTGGTDADVITSIWGGVTCGE